jgi:hypothetical protein
MKYFNTISKKEWNKEELVKHSQLLIENYDDLNKYIHWNSLIRSKQAGNFWIGFKSQNYRQSMSDYYAHERECRNTVIQNVLSLECENRATTSLLEYCQIADKILFDIYSTMKKFLDRGELVRVNHLGGYSPYHDGMFIIDDMIEITDDNQIMDFILTGELSLSMEITKKSIYMENADKLNGFTQYDKEILDKLQKYYINKEDIQIFNQFKLKTILWDGLDYIKFFVKGIENGLENIIFESDFQDMKQFNGLKSILESVMLKYPDNTMNVYIKKHTQNKVYLTTTSPNIKIIIL